MQVRYTQEVVMGMQLFQVLSLFWFLTWIRKSVLVGNLPIFEIYAFLRETWIFFAGSLDVGMVS